MLKRMLALTSCASIAGLVGIVAGAGAVLAGYGQPVDGQLGLQQPATEVAREIQSFYDIVNYLIIAITLFVLALLLIVIFKFNAKANPVPSKTTHNTLLEVAWTVIPILILVAIAVPSFKLLYLQYSYPKPDLTIKATGHAWFWSYTYPDQDDIEIESYALSDEDAKAENKPRLLAVDNEIVVPVNKVVHVLVTSDDVIHNWTIPSFGSKIDAVPGRTTTTWFKAEREGVYYGQCSELCGKDHARMPIAVRVVNDDVFNQWVAAWQDDDDEKAKEILDAVAAKQAGQQKVADAAKSTQ
jgi:cytochrome c oxidase subunit II